MNRSPDPDLTPAVVESAFPRLSRVERVAEGGQKSVFSGYLDDAEKVAVKLLKAGQDADRVLREIEAASRFSPPLFPLVYAWGQVGINGSLRVYIIEEYIEGVSLRALIRQGPLEADKALVISKGILMALSQVADAKLVHRDLKPENVMVSPSGRVVLLDFGIARHLTLPSLTQDTAVLGPLTPGYGAPEQIQNQKRAISPRTDLFAWAVVVYEMVSGRNPFTHGCRDPQEALVKTLNYEVPDLTGCDPRLSDAVRVCIRKAAHRRPSHPSVVLDMLEVQQ